MRRAGVLLSLAAAAAGQQLLELTAENFNDALANSTNLLVEVYAPWCGTCRMVAPEFARAAELAAERGLPVTLGKVNSDKERELVEALGATKYPTFFLYRGDGAGGHARESFPMLGTGEAYVGGLARMLGVPGADAFSPAKEYGPGASSADLASWLFWRGADGGKLATTLVLYAPPALTAGGCGGEAEHAPAAEEDGGQCTSPPAAQSATAVALATEAAFTAAANEAMRDPNLRFAIVRSPAIFEDFEVPVDRASIVLYKDHDEGRAEYAGPLEAGALVKWLHVQNVPLVAHISHLTLQRYRKNVKTLALLFVDEAQTEHLPTLTHLMGALQGVAYALEAEGLVKRGEFTLGVVNGKKYASWMQHYGLPAGVTPALAAEDTTVEALYALEDSGAAWATEAQCGPEAPAAVGKVEAWTVELSKLCSAEQRAAAAARLTVAADGSVAEEGQGRTEVEYKDPEAYRPLTVAHINLPTEPVAAWLRAYFKGHLAPVKAGDKWPFGAALGGGGVAA